LGPPLQIEFHPYFLSVHGPTYELNKKHGILTASYSGLAPLHKGKGGPLDAVLDRIAEALSKRAGKPVSPAQVLGKWQQVKGNVFVS
jgi:diketogulonate reductase-like aldo/keto reductase